MTSLERQIKVYNDLKALLGHWDVKVDLSFFPNSISIWPYFGAYSDKLRANNMAEKLYALIEEWTHTHTSNTVIDYAEEAMEIVFLS